MFARDRAVYLEYRGDGMSQHDESTDGASGDAVQFIQAVFDELEDRFRTQFSARWTVEINSLYEETQQACLRAARLVDARLAAPGLPSRHIRILTNYPPGSRR